MNVKQVGTHLIGAKQFNVCSCDTVANSPVISPFLLALAELIEKGQAESTIINANNYPAIFLEENKKIAGFTVYVVIKETKILWKFLTFVDPKYRQQGIAHKLNSIIDDIAKRNNCIKIQSHVHVSNDSMIACNKASGMTAELIKFNKDVPH